MSSLLITGANGFTGSHLHQAALAKNFKVYTLSANITDAQSVHHEIQAIQPDYVIHLAAISAVTHTDELAFYKVNVLGTLNLLKALSSLASTPKKIILASSANVYGNNAVSPIQESNCPNPINHYATSKLAMEHMGLTYANTLPIVLVRPFNYTGVGHDERFVIPKMIQHFVQRKTELMLGNLQVEREFNDVRTVCSAYLKLLEHAEIGEIYNICSGRTFSLQTVIYTLETLTKHQTVVKVNPEFVRPNEVYKLCGDPSKLENCIGSLQHPSLEETLQWMLSARSY